MKRNTLQLVSALFLLFVLSGNSIVFACGPFTLEAIFVYSVHPTFPLERFASGQIGVVQPTYARSYLYVAYRYLSGASFAPSEQKALVDLWHDRLNYGWELGESNWIESWLAARKKVKGAPEPPKIDVYRSREKPNEFETFVNCQKDSFDRAVKTLDDRIAKFGVENPTVLAWVNAQDQVFANCSSGSHIPASADQAAGQLARADREYQIAAAQFYATNFDAAITSFAKVAADSNSPWHLEAPYLIARSFVRKGSLGPAETREASLRQAEVKINEILANPGLSEFHNAAHRLLDLVRLRLYPKERLRELSHVLVNEKTSASLKQDLWDYTVLLDQFLENEDNENKPGPPDIRMNDDLTDWIATLEDPAPDSLNHALEKWHQSNSQVWFIAAISLIDPKNAAATGLITEALKVKPTSPAFASAQFNAVRLLIGSGKVNDARSLLDRLLKDNRAQFDDSTWNLLNSQRLLLSTSLYDFLTYAPRKPATLSWNDDGREVPVDSAETSEETKAAAGKFLFDADAATAINRELPLSLLKDAATNSSLPANLRRDLVQATWLRAVLLGDLKSAQELVPPLRSLVPQMNHLLDDFVAAQEPDAKRFAAVYAWLKFPGLEPVVDQGTPRETPLNDQDSYRDNWWCSAGFKETETESDTEPKTPHFSAMTDPPLLFLSAAERGAARREQAALNALGAGPNYLCQQVVQWATKAPADPRVPEALHLAVNSTRHGCTDKNTGRWSKAAFDLLHRKYPSSTWAKKTPYWFND